MAVWGTPEDCIEKIKFYADSIQPAQPMLNIAIRGSSLDITTRQP